MEEDAGKLIHQADGEVSLIDYNRSGVPLLEIVTEPDIRSPEEAYQYLKTLKGILEYLEVSDCDMEKGSLRCDANISLSPLTEAPPSGMEEGMLGTKVEIKNLNSFKAVARSLEYEIQRQTESLEGGQRLEQQTRLWDDAQGVTRGMRSKEYAHDYRYLPEPDLVPFAPSAEEVDAIRRTVPELPHPRARRFAQQYALSPQEAQALTASQGTADYFEACMRIVSEGTKGKRHKGQTPARRRRRKHLLTGFSVTLLER
jgi:aspartyl-tRNA(Asn)/glutamyl-tRNA(Gln) amidotransferase subunit B